MLSTEPLSIIINGMECNVCFLEESNSLECSIGRQAIEMRCSFFLNKAKDLSFSLIKKRVVRLIIEKPDENLNYKPLKGHTRTTWPPTRSRHNRREIAPNNKATPNSRPQRRGHGSSDFADEHHKRKLQASHRPSPAQHPKSTAC